MLTMKIPSNKRLIPNISEIFIQYLRAHDIKDADAMQIAFEEALTNAIVHGNNNDYNKNVNISFSIKQNMLEITIEDEGMGFNFEDYGRKIVMNKYLS